MTPEATLSPEGGVKNAVTSFAETLSRLEREEALTEAKLERIRNFSQQAKDALNKLSLGGAGVTATAAIAFGAYFMGQMSGTITAEDIKAALDAHGMSVDVEKAVPVVGAIVGVAGLSFSATLMTLGQGLRKLGEVIRIRQVRGH